MAEKLPGLLTKVTDLHKTFIPKIINAYFSTTKDYLTDNEFDIFGALFSRHLSVLNESSLVERINLWIKVNAIEKIKWLENQNVGPLK